MKLPKKSVLIFAVCSAVAVSGFALTWTFNSSAAPDQTQIKIIERICILHPELKQETVISSFFLEKYGKLCFKKEEFMQFHINSRIEQAEKDFKGTANANSDEIFKKAFANFHEEAAFFSK